MATSHSLDLFFLFSFSAILFALSHSAKPPKPTAIYFPIRKNQTSLLYYTSLEFGSNGSRTNVDALIHLGGQHVWFDCYDYNSPSYRKISCGTTKCKNAKGVVCIITNNNCGVMIYNPVDPYQFECGFGQDTMIVKSTDGHKVLFSYDSPRFQFACNYALAALMAGFPGVKTKGLAGLGRTTTSLPAQIWTRFKLAQKFTLCIPSKNGLGDIFIGGGSEYHSRSLSSTRLIVNPNSTADLYAQGEATDEYFINVEHIAINGKNIPLNSSLLSFDQNGVGGTKISTVNPYTVLHSSIYKTLVEQFIKAAELEQIKRVKSVAPFGACFNSKVAKRIAGPAVPDIDLIVEGTKEPFRLYGSDTMVEVNKNVMCLAFVDGGAEPRTSIVLGGHQLENRILEFDMASSKLRFSSSLLLWNTSCSH